MQILDTAVMGGTALADGDGIFAAGTVSAGTAIQFAGSAFASHFHKHGFNFLLRRHGERGGFIRVFLTNRSNGQEFSDFFRRYRYPFRTTFNTKVVFVAGTSVWTERSVDTAAGTGIHFNDTIGINTVLQFAQYIFAVDNPADMEAHVTIIRKILLHAQGSDDAAGSGIKLINTGIFIVRETFLTFFRYNFMSIQQIERNEELEAELKKAKTELRNRAITIENAGSLAEAALQINGVFEAADRAAKQYLRNVQRMAEKGSRKE